MAYTQRYKKKPMFKRRPKTKYVKRRPVARYAVRQVVRSEMNKQEEIKQNISNWGVASPTFTNDAVFTMAPLQAITLGTSDSQRVGQQIFLKQYLARFTFTGALASLNATFRVMAVWHDEQTTIPNISTANGGLVGGDLFFPGTHRMVNGLINNKLEHDVIYDKRVRVDSKNTSIPNGFLDVRIPLNKKVTYNSGSVYNKEKQLYILFMVSVPAASIGVASAWQVNIDQMVTYKDS